MAAHRELWHKGLQRRALLTRKLGLATPFKVFGMWYNTSLQRILRMTLGGDDKDVAYRDSRSVRRTVPRGCYGSSYLGTTAPAGTGGPDLRDRQATTILQATAFLSGCCGNGGGRYADPQFRPRRLSGREGQLGRLAGRTLREAQSHRAGDLLGLDPADGRRRSQDHRRDAHRQEGDPAGVGGLLSRRQSL